MDDKTNGRRRPSMNNYEKEGVYYTPSGKGEKMRSPAKKPSASRRPASSQTKKRARGRSQSRKPRTKKVQYAYFYILTLVVAVVVCLSVFAMAFRHVTQKETASPSPTAQDLSPKPSENPVAAVNETSIVGMINQIDFTGRTIRVLDIESKKSNDFSIGGATVLKNKYGEAMTFAEFREGDIVDARFSEDSKLLSSLKISPLAWEQKMVKNVRINTESATISIGNDTYSYDKDNIKVMYGLSSYEIANIDPLNELTLKGMGDVCWYICLEKGIGSIEIVNGQYIKDGLIEIDNNIRLPFDENGGLLEPIKVQEGTRRYVVKGSNIEPYIGTLEVASGEKQTLDLKDVKITAGDLNIIINVSDANVTIDGKAIRSNGPQILSYGTYTVKAAKDGYEPYEQEIEVDSPSKDLYIVLEETVKTMEIFITTVPTGADVFVDNEYIGLSPITARVDENAKFFTVKKAGYTEVTIYFRPEEYRYQITLIENLPQTDTGPVFPEP